jgi:hypothetical protein
MATLKESTKVKLKKKILPTSWKKAAGLIQEKKRKALIKHSQEVRNEWSK